IMLESDTKSIKTVKEPQGTEKQRNGDYYPDVVPCEEIIESGAKVPVFLETLPPETIVNEGDDVSLFCLIKGVPTPCVIWLYNQLILEESKFWFEEEEDGSYRLHIDAVSASDAGIYTCVAENTAGIVETISDLTVETSVQSFYSQVEQISHVEEE
uniref:Ig-like domain-containing protein n=1 Tax=Pelusios castaneus TaxID=367368 RepID=A0A8C8RA35_9SAUR